ncbi:MAG: YggT family protein [Ktedonobacterales bacterium]
MQPVQPMPIDVDSTAPVSSTDRTTRIVYLVFGIIEVLIGIRVILELLAANPNAGFTSLLYTVTQPFVALFQGVFPSAQSQGSVLEVSSVLAIIVYALLAFGVATIVQIMAHRETRGTPTA